MSETIIRTNGNLGNALFQKYYIKKNNNGIKVKLNLNEDYFVIDDNEEYSSEEYENNIILPKKRFFEPSRTGDLEVYIFNKGGCSCTGYTVIQCADVSYDGLTTTVHVPFSYKIKIAKNREVDFVRYTLNEGLAICAKGDIYSKLLLDRIQPVVKKVVGEALSYSTFDEIDSKLLELSESIKKSLNSGDCTLYDDGIEIMSFTLQSVKQNLADKGERDFIKQQENLLERLRN